MKARVPFSQAKPDAWPATFRRFIDARTSPHDPLARRSKAVKWRPATFRQYTISLGYFLGWLHWSNRYRDGVELVDCVTRQVAKSYFDDMERFGLAPPTIANRLDGVRAAVQALAPEQDTSWMMLGINRLRAMPSDRRRVRERIQHTADVVKVGMDLMRAADRSEGLPGPRCDVRFRDGLILVFMALAVPRINVVPNMGLGNHLTRYGNHFKIAWSSQEMKGGQPYLARLGPELSALVARYIEVYRPALLARSRKPDALKEAAVWLNKHGEPLSQNGIYKLVTERTGKAFDESVFPHALRHGAATTLAVERPDLIDIATPLLQHRYSSSRQIYNLADSISASGTFGQVLDERRAASPVARKLMRRVTRATRETRPCPAAPTHGRIGKSPKAPRGEQ